MKKLSVLLSMLFITVVAGFFWSSETKVSGQEDKGWKVWVKTSPCSGRFDWVTVAKENPAYGGGGGVWFTADLILTGTPMRCVHVGSLDCTKPEATAEAVIVRGHERFADYCCREYSVWEHSQTGKKSVVEGKFGTAGYGWRLVKPDLCCEEAEDLAGIPGACSNRDGHNCFASNPGAGSINRSDHFGWAQQQDGSVLESALKNKISLLFNCPSVTSEQVTSAFADYSVLIARYVQNSTCFNGDAGAINTNWSSHKQWAAKQTRSQLLSNLQWKMGAAFKCLDRTGQSNLFADSSVTTAKAPRK